MSAITVDLRDFKRLTKDLQTFAKKAIPHAARNALTSFANVAALGWQREISQAFVLRNSFTTRSIQTVKASGIRLDSMQSKVGSIAPYMGLQESGGTSHGKGAHKGIPTAVAAGQAQGALRTKLIRPGRKLSAIHAPTVIGARGNRKQRNRVAMMMARRKGQKFALLERPGGGKGLFLLGGGKRKLTTKLVWDVSRGSVQVKPEPTLQRALRYVEPKLVAIQQDAVLTQLKRNKVLGY
jgi:hypothetical protein